MNKARLIFLICFLSAFGAGTCVGLLIQSPGNAAQQPEKDDWLADLHLTPEQRQKMKEIWSPMRSNWQLEREKREVSRKERDEAVKALLSADQRAKYDEIVNGFQKRMDQVMQEARDAARKDRDESVKALLTDDAKPKYEEIQSGYQKKQDDLQQESRKVREEAEAKTKELLTSEQRTKYEELHKRGGPGRGHPPSRGDRKRPDGPPPSKSGNENNK